MTEQDISQLRVVIIGAGMSGMLMAIKLLEAGNRNFVVYEKASKVGGTWRENTYPNIACDVFAPAYTYSFEPNTEWNWRFGRGEEIQRYFERVAGKYQLDQYIQFDTEVTEAQWVDKAWQIRSNRGETTADVLVSAVGGLHIPRLPDIEGLDSFAGPHFHTAQWDHTVDLYDKRVGIIGTGSTAAQIVPGIVDKVKSLHLFQRTPHWVMATPDKKFHEARKKLKRRFSWINWLEYKLDLFLFGLFSHAVTGNSRLMMWLFEKAVEHNLNSVRDPVLREKLRPDYPVGCKRLVISEDFYPAIQKPNVELVTERIERITERGVVTADGTEHEFDVLVLATGFYPFKSSVNIVGLNGKRIDDEWLGAPEVYRTICVPELPNYFVLLGPFSPIGNFSIIANSELQVGYIMKCLEKIAAGGFVAMHPRQAVTQAEKQKMTAALANTVWTGGCGSWYLDATGTPLSYPFPLAQYREEMAAPVMQDFELIQ